MAGIGIPEIKVNSNSIIILKNYCCMKSYIFICRKYYCVDYCNYVKLEFSTNLVVYVIMFYNSSVLKLEVNFIRKKNYYKKIS